MPPADDYATALNRELSAAARQADRAEGSAQILAALDRLSTLITVIDYVRPEASAVTKRVIREALRAGVDPRDLYGRPFSSTVVRQVAADIGMTFPHRGRRPRRTEGR